MARTKTLRHQHDAAERLFDEIEGDAQRLESDGNAFDLSIKLARLAGVLQTHFALEDQVLYPRMIGSSDRHASLTARIFQNEMGHLAGQFDRFSKRWSASRALVEAPQQFRFEAGVLFSAIRDRIQRENRDLYPLADRLALPIEEIAPAGPPRAARLA